MSILIAILMGLKTTCFTPNFMDYINLLRLLYRPEKGKTFLAVTEIEMIVYSYSETDITIFRKKANMDFFSSKGYGINFSL